MSRIIDTYNDRENGVIVQTNDGLQWYVDSCMVPFDSQQKPYETAVIHYDKVHKRVPDKAWSKGLLFRFKTEEEMLAFHKEIVLHLETVVYKTQEKVSQKR